MRRTVKRTSQSIGIEPGSDFEPPVMALESIPDVEAGRRLLAALLPEVIADCPYHDPEYGACVACESRAERYVDAIIEVAR